MRRWLLHHARTGFSDAGMLAPTIVFDLDGTLINTAPDLIDTLNAVFARDGFPPVPYETARNLIGDGAKGMIARDLAAEATMSQRRSFSRCLRISSRIIPPTLQTAHDPSPISSRSSMNSPASVIALRSAPTNSNASRCCCSKRSHWLTASKRICGQDTFGIQKPDPEILRRTVAAAGGRLSDAIMIGDSNTDIRTARAAGIPIVAVEFGYSERPVAEYGPDRVISQFAQLPVAIAAVFSAQ